MNESKSVHRGSCSLECFHVVILCNPCFVSFLWLVRDLLGRIATNSNSEHSTPPCWKATLVCCPP